MLKGNYIFLLLASYFVVMFVGITASIRGLLLPQIKEDFNINYTTTGLMFLLPMIPGLFGSLFSGFIFDNFNKKLIIIIASIINTILFILLPFSINYYFFLIITFIISISFFVLSIGSNIGVNDFFTAKYPNLKDNGINSFHFLYALGAVISLIFGFILIKKDFDWRFIYKIIGFSSLLIVFFYILSNFPHISNNKNNNKTTNIKNYLNLLKNKNMLFYSFTAILYSGAELSVIIWAPTILENGYNMGKGYISIILILFFLFIALGRFLGTLFIQKIDQLKLFLLLCLLSILSIILGFIFRLKLFGFDIFIPLCGLFFSVMFPTIQNYIIKKFPDDANIAIGILFASCSIGSTLLPFIVGFLNDIIGVKYGLTVTVIYIALMIPILIAAVSDEKIFIFLKFKRKTIS